MSFLSEVERPWPGCPEMSNPGSDIMTDKSGMFQRPVGGPGSKPESAGRRKAERTPRKSERLKKKRKVRERIHIKKSSIQDCLSFCLLSKNVKIRFCLWFDPRE
jgi:hypothetical protein